MQFRQRQFTRSTQFNLREHGLYVCQRDAWGQVQVELEVPYEEVLPLRVDRVRRTARLRFPWYSQLAVILGGNLLAGYLTRHLSTGQLWTLLGVLGALCLFIIYYGARNWSWNTVLRTARGHFVLADQPSHRVALESFVGALGVRAKSYLRREYGTINPMGNIEPQLRRLAWLHELDVLNSAEARALTTRLTGQVPAAKLRSMGQELEGLFVN